MRLGKQFLVNLLYSIQGESFANFVNSVIEERNAKIAAERDMLIHLDPAVYEAFTGSTSVSCMFTISYVLCVFFLLFIGSNIVSRGTGAHLLKLSSKRRRTKQEMLLDAAEEVSQSQIQDEAKQRIE